MGRCTDVDQTLIRRTNEMTCFPDWLILWITRWTCCPRFGTCLRTCSGCLISQFSTLLKTPTSQKPSSRSIPMEACSPSLRLDRAFHASGALWSKGPWIGMEALGHSPVCLIPPLTRSLAPPYSLCLRAPLRLLAHSLSSTWDSEWFDGCFFWFLDAISIRGCVHPSVRRSVRPSVGPSH